MDLGPLRGDVGVDVLDLQQVLSIDQIRCIRASNDYVDRPVPSEPVAQPSGPSYGHEDQYHHHHHHQPHTHHPRHVQLVSSSSSFAQAVPPVPIPRSVSGHQQQLSHLSRSSTVSSSMSRGSAASDTRLLAGLTPSHSAGLASVSGSMAVVSAQPKGDPSKKQEQGKGLPPKVGVGRGLGGDDHLGLHLFICERCGRCKCGECVAPRGLPSCWACGQRCLCSLESAVEYGTCLCCIKGLFYHCSAEDDEDNCADRPCACTPARACARWGTIAILVPFLPCLCCYPPAKLCLALCQRGYDHATRPGCRCRNTNTVCRKISAAAAAATNQPSSFQKGLEKPV